MSAATTRKSSSENVIAREKSAIDNNCAREVLDNDTEYMSTVIRLPRMARNAMMYSGSRPADEDDTRLPAGPYVVSLLLGAFIAPFSAFLDGLNGDGFSTNQLSKMVVGAVMRGRPLANLCFASWSHQVILLTANLADWLKVGQYTKRPPAVTFAT
ncbi:OPT peptide transporter Mtd1 [Teratosphaeria destructans]|uniref:OPT peptide transporter Mtd1 n=1 Tax=Teratosphaeria destructans TaxID=418781 RepID=A0A9W7SVL8_9PEZI|nr:OPT peptide transporter Mtd1 [Teratosphaeria destructans]